MRTTADYGDELPQAPSAATPLRDVLGIESAQKRRQAVTQVRELVVTELIESRIRLYTRRLERREARGRSIFDE